MSINPAGYRRWTYNGSGEHLPGGRRGVCSRGQVNEVKVHRSWNLHRPPVEPPRLFQKRETCGDFFGFHLRKTMTHIGGIHGIPRCQCTTALGSIFLALHQSYMIASLISKIRDETKRRMSWQRKRDESMLCTGGNGTRPNANSQPLQILSFASSTAINCSSRSEENQTVHTIDITSRRLVGLMP